MALKSIFTEDVRKPKTIRFDQGGEFKSNVKKYLKTEKINVFYTHNSQIKSNYAERVIKTLKTKDIQIQFKNVSNRKDYEETKI